MKFGKMFHMIYFSFRLGRHFLLPKFNVFFFVYIFFSNFSPFWSIYITFKKVQPIDQNILVVNMAIVVINYIRCVNHFFHDDRSCNLVGLLYFFLVNINLFCKCNNLIDEHVFRYCEKYSFVADLYIE